MTQITDYGKKVKKSLIDLGEPQTWLINQVKGKTGLYFDDSYLYKIMVGTLKTPGIIQAINEILDLKEDA